MLYCQGECRGENKVFFVKDANWVTEKGVFTGRALEGATDLHFGETMGAEYLSGSRHFGPGVHVGEGAQSHSVTRQLVDWAIQSRRMSRKESARYLGNWGVPKGYRQALARRFGR